MANASELQTMSLNELVDWRDRSRAGTADPGPYTTGDIDEVIRRKLEERKRT